MKILVTGASGLIGSHCVRKLIAAGHEVHATSSKPIKSENGVVWHQANLLNHSEIDSVLDQVKPEKLIHLAWECGQYGDPIHFDWLTSSLHLAKAFHRNGGSYIFTAGSSMEYTWDGTKCSEGQRVFNPNTLYGLCKNSLGKLVSAYCDTAGIKHCHGRIFFLCGVGQDTGRLVSGMIDSLLHDKKFPCKASHLYRDYLDVEDVAKFTVALVDGNCQGDYNIASGKATKIEDIARMAETVTYKPGLIEFFPSPEKVPQDLVVEAEVNKLRSATGIDPAFDIKRTLEGIANWQRNLN